MFVKNTDTLRPLLVREVVKALMAVFQENRHADKVVESVLRQNPKAGSRDRSFIAENTYDIVRYFRLYAELLGRAPASETDFWHLTGIHFCLKGLPLPDWQEYRNLNPENIRTHYASLKSLRPVAESIPDWLDQTGEKELGADWPAILHALNEPAKVVLRTNPLLASRKQLLTQLAKEGIEAEPAGPTDAVVLTRRKNVFRTEAFRKGLFEVQDYSSQQVAPLLSPEPGMRVVDACAGGGGKTLHLASLMHNKGQVIALDIHEWKLKELKQRARRAGISNIETRPIANNKVIKRLYNSADRLLLDVPCSGLGVLRRNPDSKWKLSPEMLDELRHTQQQILQQYSPVLKPGGRMVYATCSVLPSENEAQISAFLASEAGKDFTLLAEQKIWPQDEGFDGFYMALLEKNKSEHSV